MSSNEMKLPIKTYEVDHEVIIINLFEDADGKLISAKDIVIAVNSLAKERDEAHACFQKAWTVATEAQTQRDTAIALAEKAEALARERGEAAGRRLFERLTSDEAKQAIIDRDTAQQKLAELHALANATAFDIEGIEDRGGLRAVQDAVKAIALSAAAPIADRWVSTERVQRMDDEFGRMAEKVVIANTRAAEAEARVAELETTLGYYSDEARGECTDAYRDLITRAEAAEARLRELEAPKEVHAAPAPAEDEPYLYHLYNADPDCKHKVVPATGGGVRCTKCSGWFCY